MNKIKIGDGKTLVNNLPFANVDWSEVLNHPDV
jgi:hypothetical protein